MDATKRMYESYKMALRNHSNVFEMSYPRDFVTEKSCSASIKERNEGNKMFHQKDHTANIHKDILQKYSASICLAPFPSEELILAIGNRSSLLLHLGKYKECIIDINYALKFDVITALLKIKLLCRKAICLYKINKKLQSNQVFIKVKFLIENGTDNQIKSQQEEYLKKAKDLIISNVELDSRLNDSNYSDENEFFVPYTSDAISMKFDTKYGRHLIATVILKLVKSYLLRMQVVFTQT